MPDKQTYQPYPAGHMSWAGRRLADEQLGQLAKSVSGTYRGITRGPRSVAGLVRQAWRPSTPAASPAAAEQGSAALRSARGTC
jgi:hypothetical protein